MSKLPPSLFLALRYLRPRRTFVSVITVISVLGVTLGVMVLILVISVMSGFDYELRQKILGMNSHLNITGHAPIRNWQEIRKEIEKQPHVKGVAPFVLGPVLAKFNGKIFTPYLKGVDPVLENKINRLSHFIIQGKFDLEGDQILVGREMANRFGVLVGDHILIHSPRNLETRDELHLAREAEVVGIFECGMFEYDLNFIFCSLETAQEIYDLSGKVHGLAIMSDSLESVVAAQTEVQKILPPTLRARTWMELNSRIFSAIAVEKNMMFFLLFFIIIVAAFGIMSTLITVTVQKTREIGILKSIGMTNGGILSIFLFQGMVVGTLGTGLGLSLGLLLLRFRNEFLEKLRSWTGFELFPREIYNFEMLPARINPTDIAIICLTAFFICALAGFLPALRAASMKPAQALRDF